MTACSCWPTGHNPAGGLLPTPRASDTGTPGRAAGKGFRPPLSQVLISGGQVLLPSPRASDGTKGCPGQRGSKGDLTLPAAAVRLLPTPTVSDANGTGGARGGGPNLATVSTTTHGLGQTDWGRYRPAIDRWAIVLGRQAPAPTQPGTTGTPVLAPALVEWLMGLPEGWVTDPALGLRRTVQLRLLGNGVVPQQAALALRILLCPHLWASP